MNAPTTCSECRVTTTPMECEYRVFADKKTRFGSARICIPGPRCPFALLANRGETIPAGLKVKSCEWRENENGAWETGCGRVWEFTAGGPKENDVTYCHNCGGRIEQRPYFGGME